MAPRPSLSHFGIFVRDLERMEAFYSQVFGLAPTDRGKGITIQYDFVFLSSDPTKHHQLVLASGRPPEAVFSTVMQMSFRVDSLAELRAARDRAKDQGVSTFNAIDHGNAWSVYFEDPEGNPIEVYVDTDLYVPQPHSGELDLDLSDEEIRARSVADCARYEGVQPIQDWRATFASRLEGEIPG